MSVVIALVVSSALSIALLLAFALGKERGRCEAIRDAASAARSIGYEASVLDDGRRVAWVVAEAIERLDGGPRMGQEA